jgi:hypothetical protein
MTGISTIAGAATNNASIALTLMGGSVSSSSGPTMSALAGYQPYVANENQKIATYSQQSSVQQAVSYYEANIGKIKSVQQLVQDPKLFNVVLTAFGLQSESNAPALIQQVIESDTTQQSSLANTLLDPRYQQLAKEFDYAQAGLANFADPSVISDVVNRYLTNAYEYSLDNVNPALQNAAYFLRNVGSITNAYSILGDPVLRNVFETTTGLPAQIANLPVQDEANLVNSKVDIKQFETSGSSTGSTSTTSAALTSAKNDLTKLSSATATVSAAQTAAQSVVNQIQSIQQAYTNLSTIQDPSGQFASEIPVQEAAAPVLVEQQGLLSSAQSALGTVTANIAQLQQLIQQAGSSSNTTAISSLQAQFTTLTNQIESAISGASYQFDNGTGGTGYTSVNLLDGSMSSQITATYDSNGDQTAVNAQNLGSSSSFQAQLNAASAAFQSVSSYMDGTNIQAAQAALASAQNAASIVNTSVTTDASKFQTAISAVPQWAGTYNTAQLYQGSQSLADAGSRMTQVNQLLAQVKQLAAQATQMTDTADHTSLQSQYSDLITQLSQAITQATNPNVDNLLQSNPGSTPGYYSYSLDANGNYDVQAHTNDLASSVLGPLQNLDVSTAANANAVISDITGSIQTAMANASTQLGVDSQTFSLAADTIDPRAAVDDQYRQLVTTMPNVVKQAASNGTNLLDATQSGLTLNVSSTEQTININPEDFDSEVTQVLSAGSQLLPSDPNDTSGAIAALNNAAFNATNILDSLNGDVNQVQFATSVTNTNITALQKQQGNLSSTSAGLPAKPNAFAIQFVQKYLATVDGQNAAAGSGASSAAIQLLQGGSQNLDQTIGSALLSGTLNISV